MCGDALTGLPKSTLRGISGTASLAASGLAVAADNRTSIKASNERQVCFMAISLSFAQEKKVHEGDSWTFVIQLTVLRAGNHFSGAMAGLTWSSLMSFCASWSSSGICIGSMLMNLYQSLPMAV